MKLRTTVLLLALVATACKTTETRTTMYESYGAPERLGTVAWIKETEKDEKGNPVGGAALGAVIGGVAGYAMGGSPVGAVVGAVGGGTAGALLSQGSGEKRWFDVNVRFDEGGEQAFRFENTAPFVVGERVGVVGNTVRSLGSRVAGPPAGQHPSQQPASQSPAKAAPAQSN